jgi:acetyl esterase
MSAPAIDIPPELAPESRRIMERGIELGLLTSDAATVEEVRAESVKERELMAAPPALERIEDVEIAGPAGPLPLRVYRPPGEPPFPTILFVHGGGWIVGDLDHADVDCRCLALDTGALLVSVGYRLAPEHPFPAGLEDALAAAEWVAAEAARLGGDPARITVAGDSAGGNLAAALCLLAARGGGPRIAHQLLIYPATDCAFETESYRRYAEGYWLEREAMRWFWELYVGDPGRGADALASVLRAPDLRGLPPATIVTAGCDVLRDEGEAYGKRLREAGVPVDLRRYAGQLHGFWSCGGVTSLPRRVNAELAAAVAAPPRAARLRD